MLSFSAGQGRTNSGLSTWSFDSCAGIALAEGVTDGLAGGLRVLRRITEGKEIVFSEKLEPGTTLVITNDPAGVPMAAEAVVGPPPSAAAPID